MIRTTTTASSARPASRVGSPSNRLLRTILLPAFAVIAAMLAIAPADAAAASQPGTVTAQAAHEKKRCKKGTHRKVKRKNGKRHVHCVRTKKKPQAPTTGVVPGGTTLPTPPESPASVPDASTPPPGASLPTPPDTPPPPPPAATARLAQTPAYQCWPTYGVLPGSANWFGARNSSPFGRAIWLCWYDYGYVAVMHTYYYNGDLGWQYWFRTNYYPNGYWESPGD